MNKVVLFSLALVFVAGCSKQAEQTAEVVQQAPEKTEAVAVEQAEPVHADEGFETDILILKQGQTLTNLLMPHGFSERAIYLLAMSSKKIFDINKLQAGTQIELTTFEDAQELKIAVGFAKLLEAKWQNQQWSMAVSDVATDKTSLSREFVISHSLYKDALSADVPVKIINDAILALSHFIDFQREVHKGDGLAFTFEQISIAEQKHLFTLFKPEQTLLYVDLSNQEQQLELFKYQNQFYFQDGRLAENFLMKTPLNGARLSSHFGRRKHPVLGYTRIHKGIDFGAPIGTPIMAAGNAKVLKAGRLGSFGNRVVLDHGNGYETLYAHLKGFAKGIKPGVKVRQGQIIGYLGNTGLSQARHLHYEVHKDGKAINPLKMKQPSHLKLKGKDLAAFHTYIKRFYRQQLETDEQPSALAAD